MRLRRLLQGRTRSLPRSRRRSLQGSPWHLSFSAHALAATLRMLLGGVGPLVGERFDTNTPILLRDRGGAARSSRPALEPKM